MKDLFFLILMNFVWAGSCTVVKIGLGSMSPLSLIFLRMSLASIIFLAWILFKRVKLSLNKKEFFGIFLLGVVIAGSHILWVGGIKFSGASDAAILYSFEPIWAIILASLILKERFRFTMGVGLVLALIGLAILSRVSSLELNSFFLPSIALGNLMIIVGLFFEGTYSIIAKFIIARQPALIVVAGGHMVAALILAIPALSIDGLVLPKTPTELGVLFYLVVPCTLIGGVLWVNVMKRIPVNIMLYTIFIQPVVGPFIAAIVIGETLDKNTIAGGSLIIAGVALAISSHLKSSASSLVHST